MNSTKRNKKDFRKWYLFVAAGILTALLTAFIVPDNSYHRTKKINHPVKQLRSHPSSDITSQKPDTLPLLSIMAQLESDVNMISRGIWRHNFQMIKKGANNIAHHPKIPNRQVKRIKEILSPEQFQNFKKTDQQVHQSAIKIAEFATSKNFQKTTDQFIKMERGCISCHIDLRNDIRSSGLWR